MSRSPDRVAAIDVGSNTFLLLVADYDPAAGLTVIEEAEDQPRLGAGLSATGRLSDAAIERGLESLTRLRDICRRHGVARIGAAATAAVREAENGKEFVERVRAIGIPLRIISPETEAALSYRSAAHHFPGRGRMLVADIGGGSLELVGALDDRIELTDSLPLGAVRLTEQRVSLTELRDQIRSRLARAIARTDWTGSRVIGSGGTFATLASVLLPHHGLQLSHPIHGMEVTARDLEWLLAELSEMSQEQRRKVPGLKPERADIIVAGLAVAAELLQHVNARSVKVNGYGLREGLILELLDLK